MSESSGTSPVLDRIAKLLALATSPNEHEARTASFVAAKLIREHGVVLSLAAHRPTSPNAASRVIVIVSMYTGRCRTCGDEYKAGDRIQWARGMGAAHLNCAWAP